MKKTFLRIFDMCQFLLVSNKKNSYELQNKNALNSDSRQRDPSWQTSKNFNNRKFDGNKRRRLIVGKR